MWIQDVQKDIKERRVSGIIFQNEENPVHNRPENIAKAKELLSETVGSEWVTDEPTVLIGYSRDQSPLPSQYTHLVVLPESTEQVRKIYEIANETLVDVKPMGTGLSTMALHIPMYGGIIMDLRRMDKVLEVDGENLHMVIQPGVNFMVAQIAAQKQNARVLNPSTSATAGVISNHGFCNINTLSSKFGFGIDGILDMVMVLPDATMVKTGPGSYGAVKAHVGGPGPDAAPVFRFAFGTLGTVTELAVRIYPEQAYIDQIFPFYEKDDLRVVIDALYEVANENVTLELAHMQNSFFGIFCGDDNKEAGMIADMFPRNNYFLICSGSTKEEAKLKTEIVSRIFRETSDEFDFMPFEAVNDVAGVKRSVNLDRWQKFFNVTVRVMRVRGSFLIGAIVAHMDHFYETEKKMRTWTTNQIGHTEDSLPPDDASTYIQPYHMGRSAYMEYDVYTCQGEKDDIFRVFMGYMRALTGALLGDGLAFAAGAFALIKGMPLPMPEGLGISSADQLLPLMMPAAALMMDVFTEFKMKVDPNNIAARRWDYETGVCSKMELV